MKKPKFKIGDTVIATYKAPKITADGSPPGKDKVIYGHVNLAEMHGEEWVYYVGNIPLPFIEANVKKHD